MTVTEMYEFSGKIKDLAFDYATEKALLTLSVNEEADAKQLVCSELRDAEISVKIDKHRKKRSLNANSYAWKLIGEVADRLRAGKDEIYLLMLKRYGQSEMVSALAAIPMDRYFKYFEEAGESCLNGKLFKHYRIYKGSSEFDTREMSVFIDGIVSEAKALGIQTETPEELLNIKSLWETGGK